MVQGLFPSRRLANPLVNELIIDTASKDFWNAEEPKNEAQFQEFYQNPSVALALKLIFGMSSAPDAGRTDLVSVVPEVSGPGAYGDTCGKPMR